MSARSEQQEPLRKTAVLGGSFDPVHLGHLHMAAAALEHGGVDEVWLLPARCPPHKNPGALAPAEQRLAMLFLAAEQAPRVTVCTVELERDDLRYTLDTLSALARDHAGRSFSFLVGADSLFELRRWHRAPELVDRFEILSVPRAGFDLETVTPARLGFDQDRTGRLRAGVLPAEAMAVSSTEVRKRVAQGQSIRYLVPAPVAAYIADHDLYRAPGESYRSSGHGCSGPGSPG